MRNKIILSLLFLVNYLSAQILDPVKWKTSIVQNSDSEFTLIFDASIDDEWHLYSQFTPDGGALPTEFKFKNNKNNYELVGKTTEGKYKKVMNDIFGVEEYYFAKTAQFKQNIKVLNGNLKEIKVDVDYQVCKEQCINDNKSFTFQLPKLNIASTTPVIDTVKTTSTEETVINNVESEVKTNETISKKTDEPKSDQKGILSIFLLSFASGFLALLTPCVFPMIPLTVSYFTKQSKNKIKGMKNAILYGISIIVIYVILGTIVTAIFGADVLNALSTNVFFNVLFFLLLIIFGLSFLGAFEIVLPSSWINKMDSQSNKSGFLGIFFMALVLALVSFSCTGPIVGSLLVEAASKGGLAPIIGMFGFSLAIALPFMFFALFPAWLNAMPKSGGWLNTVKVSLGFLELALAFKFLSKADLVSQSHLLPREIFIVLWIAIFGAWALYLFGKFKLPHDSDVSHLSVGRVTLAILVTSFVFYMIPGLWGAPLNILSGITPPLYYSESPNGFGNSTNNITSSESIPNSKIISNGLRTFTDYQAGLDYAKKQNKPVFLDFTGHGCENCRKMEDNVWAKPEILNILKNDVVIISLYVDEKEALKKENQYVSKTTGKSIETVGNKWSDFQITNYQANAQPLYVILDYEGNRLSTETATYNTDVDYFKNWLKEGISKFKK
jgi:thiol:disulfide interchange protein